MSSKIIAFAINAHQQVNHLYDNYPYSLHLSMVAMYAQKYINIIPSQFQEVVLNACWLHDTIEDCRLTYNDVRDIAGDKVADIVYAVSNEKGKTRKERANENYYKGICNTPYATFVKLCDRLANVKYSQENNSMMLLVYKKENENFVKSLFPNENDIYKEMIVELSSMFA